MALTTSALANEAKCAKAAARAAEKFATTIVYPEGRIEDRAVAYLEKMAQSVKFIVPSVYFIERR